jgi:pyruvate formate lyase activating enzyme
MTTDAPVPAEAETVVPVPTNAVSLVPTAAAAGPAGLRGPADGGGAPADGVGGFVAMSPSDVPGTRLRGTAAGVGADDEDLTAEERTVRFAQMRAGEIASVHSWELVTAVDGPGTRMTLFLAGCPLRCVYCHNPDTLRMQDGTLQTLEDVWARIRRYKRVFKASGGGVTISGGEPMFQLAFLRNLLRRCHDEGIHTAIDTSGFLGARVDDAMLDTLDLVLLDVKSGIPEVYQRVTGQALQPTIDFGNRLNAAGKRVWIRFVVVPGWTDSVENVEAVADIVASWSRSVERVEVLPFHNMGQDKWDGLGLEYRLRDVKPPSAEVVERVRQQFRARGLQVF